MQKLVSAYKFLALMLLNTLVIFALINIVFGIYYTIRDRQIESEAVGSLQYGDERLGIAYPGLDPNLRDAMLIETWSRPLICAPFVHFRERPFRGQFVNVDEGGFRWNGEQQPWPPEDTALNIFVFGGSTTFGYGVADGETIPAQMQLLLAQAFPDKNIQVYNFGQGYYFSSQELRLYEQLLQEGHYPDIVVFIDGVNDMTMNGEPHDWKLLDCSPDAQDDSFELPIARFARSLRRTLPVNEPPLTQTAEERGQRLSEQKQYDLQTYIANREMIKAISDQWKVKTVFVWQPHPQFKYDLTYHVFAQGSQENVGYILMDEMHDEWMLWDDFLYLADIQQDKRETLYVDNIHYTVKFSAEIAFAVVEFILQKQILD